MDSCNPLGHTPEVVNYAGIGGRDLVPDPELMPIRAQLVVVENPALAELVSEDSGLSTDLLHFSPHGDRVILGGVAEPVQSRASPRDARVHGHWGRLRPTR